jgi:hypothetical protein
MTMLVEKSDPLTEVNFLKESDLIKMAASNADLMLRESNSQVYSRIIRTSEIVETLDLDMTFLDVLKTVGFTFRPGIKPPHDTMIYLSGNSDQRGQDIFDSDCWAWKRTETEHRLAVYFRLFVDENARGVICVPEVSGNCDGGACHRPTIDKLMGIITTHFPNMHPLIRRITKENPHPVIGWSEIGLGGIRSVGWLFDESYGQNRRVGQLADTILSPFIPSPRSRFNISAATDRLFVLESDQPQLFRQWKNQLGILRSELG